MTHSDQSSENDISGVVIGGSVQASSVRDVYMGGQTKPRWLKGLQYVGAPVAVAVALTAVTIAVVPSRSPSEPAQETPIALTGPASVETTTTSMPLPPAAPVPRPTGQVVRPTQAGPVPRPAGGTTTTSTSPPTSTVPKPVTPVGDGVRFSGELRFASFHLDPVPPRDVPESNVWALTPKRLHGDPGYWLAEWFSEGVPGRAECLAHLSQNATLDADNVVVGSKVCGKSPAGRIFLIDVSAMDGSSITGHVTVWEAA